MASWRALGASSLCVLGSAGLVAAMASCSATQDHHGGFGGDSSGTQSSGAGLDGSGGGSSQGQGGFNPVGTGAGAGSATGAGGGCASNKTKAMSKPLDMYIMLDQSGSM